LNWSSEQQQKYKQQQNRFGLLDRLGFHGLASDFRKWQRNPSKIPGDLASAATGIPSVGGAIALPGKLSSSKTIGEILKGYGPNTMLHLTPEKAAAFKKGIDQGTYFAKLGDVSKMTVTQYQEQVVGTMAAAGPGQKVNGFVAVGAKFSNSIKADRVWNSSNTMEYTNTQVLKTFSYISLD
jgi:hypothetical protein